MFLKHLLATFQEKLQKWPLSLVCFVYRFNYWIKVIHGLYTRLYIPHTVAIFQYWEIFQYFCHLTNFETWHRPVSLSHCKVWLNWERLPLRKIKSGDSTRYIFYVENCSIIRFLSPANKTIHVNNSKYSTTLKVFLFLIHLWFTADSPLIHRLSALLCRSVQFASVHV